MNDLKKDILHKIDFEQLKNSKSKKILVFGNSHGADLYYTFSLKKDLSKKYIFNYIPRQISCLSVLVSLDNSDYCSKDEIELNNYIKKTQL